MNYISSRDMQSDSPQTLAQLNKLMRINNFPILWKKHLRVLSFYAIPTTPEAKEIFNSNESQSVSVAYVYSLSNEYWLSIAKDLMAGEHRG